MAGFGFKRDTVNGRLRIEVAGTEVVRQGTDGSFTFYGGMFTIDAGGLVVSAGDFTVPATSVAVAALASSSYNGRAAENAADVNTSGAPLLLFRIKTAGGATATINVTSTHKIRVLDFWTVNAAAGSAADTVQLLNGATAITDALDINDVDTTISKATTISDASYEIAAGGTIRITETDGGGSDSPAVDCYVLACRVA